MSGISERATPYRLEPARPLRSSNEGDHIGWPPPSNCRLFDSYGVAGAGVVPVEAAPDGAVVVPISPVAPAVPAAPVSLLVDDL